MKFDNKAIDLDFTESNFSKSEWPNHEYVLSNMSSEIFESLFDFRNSFGNGVYPSPLEQAHVRDKNSGSRHDIHGGERLSDATDIFVKRNLAKKAYSILLATPNIRGLGIYRHSLYNGEKDEWVMLHIDTRPQNYTSLWAADRETSEDNFEYISYQADFRKFFQVLTKGGFFD